MGGDRRQRPRRSAEARAGQLFESGVETSCYATAASAGPSTCSIRRAASFPPAKLAQRRLRPPQALSTYLTLHTELELREFTCTACGTRLEVEVAPERPGLRWRRSCSTKGVPVSRGRGGHPFAV